MPSPFPGMDPYLESASMWKGFHAHLISALDTELNRILPRNYVANIEERVYVEPIRQSLYPDAYVRKKRRRQPNGAAPALAVADPGWELRLEDHEVHEPYLEIIDLEERRKIIAEIEVLSPGNKRS